ncbi:MAG: hypothetical protein ABI353_01125 [Isosphaeraceae bacterium]
MRRPIAMMAMTSLSFLASTAVAQGPSVRPTNRGGVAPPSRLAPTPPSNFARPATPATAATRAPNAGQAQAPAPAADSKVYRSGEEIARSEYVPGDPNVTLAAGRVEDYLLQKEHGPFMVVAMTFRGAESSRYAVALTRELREQFQLPAYIFYLKIKPGRSNIRDVSPTAAVTSRNGDLAAPRAYDEAAVLVGHCKTIDEAGKLLHSVKKLRPKCLDGMDQLSHRRGKYLKSATMTTNPLAASQNLYPGREVRMHGGAEVDTYQLIDRIAKTKQVDPFVAKLNGNRRSLYHCPGPYTLQVAEFSGRSTTNASDRRFFSDKFLGTSPLGTAYDDAERVADVLEKNSNWLQGMKVYTYHDRTTSRVVVGSFASSTDPAVLALKNRLVNQVPQKVVQEQKIPLPLNTTPLLVGTPQGAAIHDTMVQQTAGAVAVPELIPIPTR